MEEKKHFFCLLRYLVGAGVILAVFIFCIDPFYHYHKPWFGLPIILENAVYQTPGAAEHLEYDSVIIGTSMTENFHASWFDEMGWNTVKLSYSGARTDDLRAILLHVFNRKEVPEHIVMDINTYQLTEPSWTAYVTRPQYLYDENILTDVAYLFNYDVFLQSIERIRDGLQGRESNLDDAYTWEDEAYFGRQAVLEDAASGRQQILERENQEADLTQMLKRCDENLDNIIPFIEAHPETRFYIYYPPYSMFYWEQEIIKGDVFQLLEVFRHSMQRLSEFDNVQLFYFQDETDIITNPDNYRDITHHRPEYNRYIYECIRDQKGIVTQENIDRCIDAMYQYVMEFDYSSLWED